MLLVILALVENPQQACAEEQPVRADGETKSEKVETVAGNLEVTSQTYVPPEVDPADANQALWKFKQMGASATGEKEYAIPLFDPASFKAEFVAPGKAVDDKVKLKFTSVKDLDPMNADQWGLGAKGEVVRAAPPGGGAGAGGPQKKDWKEKVNVSKIIPLVVDRDNPTGAWGAEAIVATGAPVYAGGTTGDLVNFRLVTATYEASYAWTATRKTPASPAVVVTGPTGTVGGFSAAGPPNLAAASWKIDTFDWKPGIYTVKCKVTKAGIESTYQREQEVGVRTDDVVVIGWINPKEVPLLIAGVQPDLLRVLPETGVKQGDNNAVKIKAASLIKYISEHDVDSDFNTRDPRFLAVPDIGLTLYWLYGDDFKAFSAADKKYTLCWMFKHGANVSPATMDGGDFQEATPSAHFSQAKLDAYIAKNTEHTHFKLMNHFQVKFLTDGAHAAPIPFKAGTLKYLQHEVAIGNTKDPTRFYEVDIWAAAAELTDGYPHGGVFPGKRSALNGTQAVADSVVSQYNEGSPDQKAMDAFTHLHGAPVTFNIWSRINFFSDLASYHETISPTTHVSLTRVPKPTLFYQAQINTQLYPTYWIYINGELKHKQVQNADPLELIKQKDNAQ